MVALKSAMEIPPDELKEAIGGGDLTIGVYALGRMGLPTACLFAEAGAKVIGVDINPHIVDQLNAGKSPIEEPNLQPLIRRHVSEKRLIVTGDATEAAAKCDIIIIVVPTLIDKRKRPDYSAVEKACKGIGLKLRKGCLVIFESTVGLGVTEKIVKGTLENASGLKAGTDFGLAYSPIRATAGRVLRDMQSYPKIVAGLDMRSLEAASAVMGTIVKGGVVKVMSIKTAEATKLFENVYRDVNIALANELALMCERNGIRFEEVRAAANTQPYSHLHTPSIGVGGECIPVNPYFLIDSGEEVGLDMQLTKRARRINDGMPLHTVKLVTEALRECGKTLKRSKVAVLGVSYRANVKEARASPSTTVIEMLMKKGAKVTANDPYFTAKEIAAMGYPSKEGLEATVDGVDCILAAVGHDQFKGLKLKDLMRLIRKPACIVDGCHIFDPSEARREGFIYIELGSGA